MAIFKSVMNIVRALKSFCCTCYYTDIITIPILLINAIITTTEITMGSLKAKPIATSTHSRVSFDDPWYAELLQS